MTSPLQGGGRRFKSGWAHFSEPGLFKRAKIQSIFASLTFSKKKSWSGQAHSGSFFDAHCASSPSKESHRVRSSTPNRGLPRKAEDEKERRLPFGRLGRKDITLLHSPSPAHSHNGSSRPIFCFCPVVTSPFLSKRLVLTKLRSVRMTSPLQGGGRRFKRTMNPCSAGFSRA